MIKFIKNIFATAKTNKRINEFVESEYTLDDFKTLSDLANSLSVNLDVSDDDLFTMQVKSNVRTFEEYMQLLETLLHALEKSAPIPPVKSTWFTGNALDWLSAQDGHYNFNESVEYWLYLHREIDAHLAQYNRRINLRLLSPYLTAGRYFLVMLFKHKVNIDIAGWEL